MVRLTRLAYLTPLAPVQTDTSYYSEELLPHLCRHAQVDVYTDDRLAAAQEVGKAYRLYGYHDLVQAGSYDHRIYQLGSHPAHLPVLQQFLRYGGVLVLHDADLSALIEAGRNGHGDGQAPLNGVRRTGGLWPFLQIGYNALLHQPWVPRRWQRDGSVLEQAAGVIVHSRAARRHIVEHYPRARVRQVPIGVRRPPAIDPLQARQALELPQEAFIAVSPLESTGKGELTVLLQGFAQLLERWPQSWCLLAGWSQPDSSLATVADAAGVSDRVRVVRCPDVAALYRCLAAADVVLSLGQAGCGHLPPSLLRAMSLGRPAVVPNCPPYDELPADCAIRVEPGTGVPAQLAATLWAMAAHPAMRHWYGQCAARYVQSEHTPAATARHYLEFLERLSLPHDAGEPGIAEQRPACAALHSRP
jgi:glycosyltransferase involved in cell wall biosynthesis